MSKRPRTEELVAAYMAGGAELSAEERAAVEALLDQSPAARAEADAIGGLFAELRELEPEPPAASEAVVRAVRIACAEPPPTWSARARAWLVRRWALAVTAGVAGAAVIALVAVQLARAPAPSTPQPTAVAPPAAAPPGQEPPAHELWLAGEEVELDTLDDAQVRVIEHELAAALEEDEVDENAIPTESLLPADDLGWVDELDDAEIEIVDRWLDRQPV